MEPATPTATPTATRSDDEELRRIEIRNPYKEEDGLFPAEGQWVALDRHTISQDGKHTIKPLTDEPLTDSALKTIESKPRHREADTPEGERNVQMREPIAKTKAKSELGYRAGQGLNPADPSGGVVRSKNNNPNRRRARGRRNRTEEEQQGPPDVTMFVTRP